MKSIPLVCLKVLPKYPFFDDRYHAVELTPNGGFSLIPFSQDYSDKIKIIRSINIYKCSVVTYNNKRYVVKAYEEDVEKAIKYSFHKKLVYPQNQIEVGSRVHIYSRNGMYIVKDIDWFGVVLTTGHITNDTWRIVPHDDIKCRAGGRYI